METENAENTPDTENTDPESVQEKEEKDPESAPEQDTKDENAVYGRFSGAKLDRPDPSSDRPE